MNQLFGHDWAKKIIAALGRDAFVAFVGGLLERSYAPWCERVDTLGPLPCYKRLLRRGGLPIPLGHDFGLYVIDPLPFHVLSKPRREDLHSPDFLATIEAAWKRTPGRELVFILNNSAFLRENVLQDWVLPEYAAIVEGYGLQLSMVGNADSIAANELTEPFLVEFLQAHHDGVSIELGKEEPTIRPFLAQSYLSSGRLEGAGGLLEPTHFSPATRLDALADEFERLLRSEPLESQLEGFLREHYREFFGFQYDRVEAQIWLRLPPSDISRKSRRLDMFLRNSLKNDWELVELKRSTVPLAGNVHDIPRLSAAVRKALAQTEHYVRLLKQDELRRKLAVEGIEYFEPTAQLVIGRRPTMTTREWRYLLAGCRSPVKLATYDDLIGEMRSRVLPFRTAIQEE